MCSGHNLLSRVSSKSARQGVLENRGRTPISPDALGSTTEITAFLTATNPFSERPAVVIPGEIWFRKDTLDPVEIVGVRSQNAPDWAQVQIRSPGAPQTLAIIGNDVLDEYYRRDEPLTLELLERMGWEVSKYSSMLQLTKRLTREENGFDGLGLVWRPYDQPPRGFHQGMTLVRWECSAVACQHPLAPVTTLRALLVLLRVLGVEGIG